VRVLMMHLMERLRERVEPVAHPAVDHVFDEGPGEKARQDDRGTTDHAQILSPPVPECHPERRPPGFRSGIHASCWRIVSSLNEIGSVFHARFLFYFLYRTGLRDRVKLG
jgi:hypothetical protein